MEVYNNDHSADTTEDNIYYLNQFSRVSELFFLFLMITPTIFIGNNPLIFFMISAVLLVLIVCLALFDDFLSHQLYLKFIVLSFMGFTIGVLQLDPIPTLAIALLAIFNIQKTQLIEKFLLLAYFFLCAFTFVFLLKMSDLSVPHHNFFVNFSAVISLVMGLLSYLFSENLHYKLLLKKYEANKNRYAHFVSLANKLARYAPAPVWQKIILEEKDVTLENKRRKLTIFFSDIKGFTELSDTMSAEDLTFFLNSYFESMSKIAKKHGGTVDKFIGDALLVFFGDPDTEGEREDALKCVDMAVDMAREISRLRNLWNAMGFDGLHVRMGINTGYCHVGNFGSATRLSYTIVGKEANMASRIQDAAEVDSIYISEATHNLIKNRFLCEKVAPVALKGFAEPVQLWRVRRHRQGNEIADSLWIEHNLQGFNLHLNMLNINSTDKEAIKTMLIKAGRVIDKSIKQDKNIL